MTNKLDQLEAEQIIALKVGVASVCGQYLITRFLSNVESAESAVYPVMSNTSSWR